ncbi:hypothetical protein HMPREF1548_02753 [Clostridium sp. KLE 1755]|nr:hypothetical protein HMPREF1548_02753 [Clostridium sp. KLE 1755]
MPKKNRTRRQITDADICCAKSGEGAGRHLPPVKGRDELC